MKSDREAFDQLQATKNFAGIRQMCFDVICRDNLDLISTKLDDVFSRGLDDCEISTTPYTWFEGSLLNTATADRDNFQHQYLSAHLGMFGRQSKTPPIVSDHIALVTEVKSNGLGM